MREICNCSNNSITESLIDATHSIFETPILVKNTPVITCDNCGQKDYKDPQRLYSLLKDAYRKSTHTITYSEESYE